MGFKNTFKSNYAFVFLSLINCIFILKYGLRYMSFTAAFSTILIILGLQIGILLFVQKFYKSNSKIDKAIFWTICITFFISSIIINIYVDGNSLNVDRWSAMDVAVNSFLSGNYPYSAIDHLGGRTSNLPSLILIGIPFYLLGDVGYMQSFTFLLFAFLIHKTFHKGKTKIIVLLLLISSPCYLYEIYVKSDMISNFILVLFFVVFGFKKWKSEKIKNPVIVAALSSALLYTRLTTIIPLSLLLLKPFLKLGVRSKILFILSAISVLLVLTILMFINYPSLQILKENNPFVLQNRQLPFFLSLIFITVPFYFSTKIHDLKKLIQYCIIFLGLPVITSMFLYIIKWGVWDTIYESKFDLSYLNIVTPFIIFYIGFVLSKKMETA